MTDYPARASTVADPFDPVIGFSKSLRQRGREHRASLNVPAEAISATVDVATTAATNLKLASCARTDSNLLSYRFEGDVPQNHPIKGMVGFAGMSKVLGATLQGTVRFSGIARIMNSIFWDSLTEIMQHTGPTRRRLE